MKHLGVRLRKRDGGHKLTKDNYLNFGKRRRRKNLSVTEEVLERAYAYFYRVMKFYEGLDKEDFETIVDEVVNRYGFTEVKDLSAVAGLAGYYILVLDEYKQIYIGSSTSVRHSILTHWDNTFNLLHSVVNAEAGSPLDIDNFRALDPTRVFVSYNYSESAKEEYLRFLTGYIPLEYLANRDYIEEEEERMDEVLALRERIRIVTE